MVAKRYPLHDTTALLEAFLALPEPVAGVEVVRWWDFGGAEKVSVLFCTEDGACLDWGAVLGGEEPLEAFKEHIRAWMRSSEEEREEAHLLRKGGNARLEYRFRQRGSLAEERAVWLYRDDLPPPPPFPKVSGTYRSLMDRALYALSHYRDFWRHEAPKSFREQYPEVPNLGGLLTLGNKKGYWHPLEEEAVAKILSSLLALNTNE